MLTDLWKDVLEAFNSGWNDYIPETPLHNPYCYATQHSMWIAYKAGWEAMEVSMMDY